MSLWIITNMVKTYSCPGEPDNQLIDDMFSNIPCSDKNKDGICDYLDKITPISVINQIPSQTYLDSILLTWSASDNKDGSGIKNTELYVSKNNGPFQLFNTFKDTSIVFYGDKGNKYGFFTQAIYNAGNKEGIKSIADKEIKFFSAKKLSILTPVLNDKVCANDTLLVSWESNHVDLIDIYFLNIPKQVYYKINSSLEAKTGHIKWLVPSDLSGMKGNQIVVFDSFETRIADTSEKFLISPVFLKSDTIQVCSGTSYTFPDGSLETNIIQQIVRTINLTSKDGATLHSL